MRSYLSPCNSSSVKQVGKLFDSADAVSTDAGIAPGRHVDMEQAATPKFGGRMQRQALCFPAGAPRCDNRVD